MAGLHFDITADNSNLTKKLQETERQVKNMSQVVEREGGSIESMFSRLSKAAAAFGAGFTAKELINQVIKVRGEFQQLEVAFTTMLGSEEKATALMSQLTATAAKTPFDLQGVANGARQLLAYGTAAEDVNGTLVRLGNIAAGLSIPLNDLVYLYGTTMTQGRLYTQDLNQFTGRGIPMIRELAKEFGVAESEIKSMVEAGQIGFPEVQKVINNLTNEGGMFFNLMEQQSKTITGQISNIGDSFSMMLNDIGKSSDGIINGVLSGVSYLIENYENVGRTLLELVGTYGAYRAALITITAIQRAYNTVVAQAAVEQSLAAASGITLSNAQAMAAARTKLLQAAQASLNKTMLFNPYVAAAAAVAALGLGIYKLATYQTEAEKAQARLNEATKEYDKSIASERIQIDELFGRLNAATKGTKEWNDVKDAIISQYGEYLKGLGDENTALNDVALAYETVTKAAEKSAKARAMNQFMTSEADKLAETRAEVLANIRDELNDAFGDEIGKNGVPLADTYFWRIKPVVEGDEYIHQIDDIKKALFDAGVSNEVYQNINKAVAAAEQYKTSLEGARKIWGDAPKQGSEATEPFSTEGKSISQIEEEIKKAEASLEAFKKDLADGSGTQEAVSQQEAYIKSLQDTVLEREKDLKVISEIEAQISKLKKEQKNTVYGSKEYYSLQSRINALDTKLPQSGTRQNKSDKNQQDYSAELFNLRKENEDREVELIQDGTERQLAEIKLRYDREIAEVEKLEEELKQAQGGSLTEEQQNLFTSTRSGIEKARNRDINAVNDKEKEEEYKRIKEQEDAWNEYLIKFGDYQQKRQAIVEKYNKQIEEAQTAGEAAILYKEQQNALDELDNSIKGSTTLMGQLFADASEKSVNEIQKIIDKAELLMDYLGATKDEQGNANIDGKQVSRKQILDLGISENSLQNLELSTEETEALQKAIKRLRGEMGSRSPFKLFENQVKDAASLFKQGGKNNIAKGLELIGNAVTEFSPALSQFGKDLGNIFGSDDFGNKAAGITEAIGGLGQTGVGVAQMMQGQVVSGAMSAVGGISSLISGLEGLFGADYSQYYEMKDRYDQLSEVWDVLISKKQEYIDISYGAEALKAGQEALNLLEMREAEARRLAWAAADAGSSVGSHSIAYRQNRDLAQYTEELKKYTTQRESLTNMLINSTAEELATIRDKMSEMWIGLDSDFRNALEQIIETGEESKEVIESMKAAMTGVDFSSFQNSFADMLSDLDSTNQDFANNFEEYLQNAIFSSLVANKYKDEIQTLYDDWARYAQDGAKLSKIEVDDLREQYEEIVNNMLTDRENIIKDFGWTASEQEQQSASKGGFDTMTQDQATELSGRFTSLYEVGLQILTYIQSIQSISVYVNEQNMILLEIRNIIISSNSYLEDIASFQKRIWEKVDARLDSINNILNNRL